YRLHSSLLQSDGKDSLAVVFIQNALVDMPKDPGLLRELSDIYNAQENYFASADAFNDLFLADSLSNNDLYTGALRSLIASSVSGDDMEKRTKYGDQGLAMINKAIDPEKPSASYLWRKVLLQVTRSRVAQDDAVDTINKLLAVMNSNPEYANPANKNNYLDEYVKCYNYLISYYDRNEMTEQADAARASQEKYKALQAQIAQ
ncbi:MAG: hypothetical protein K2K84_08015, partial [Muribaculaceae bacterium]|nr:hypothetical protein [Muribaculaceae bacterium]